MGTSETTKLKREIRQRQRKLERLEAQKNEAAAQQKLQKLVRLYVKYCCKNSYVCAVEIFQNALDTNEKYQRDLEKKAAKENNNS